MRGDPPLSCYWCSHCLGFRIIATCRYTPNQKTADWRARALPNSDCFSCQNKENSQSLVVSHKRGIFGEVFFLLVDISDIFIFSARGRGKGSPRRREGVGDDFFVENPRRGGSPRRAGGRGARAARRVCAGNVGGGGQNNFFRGRNSHQDQGRAHTHTHLFKTCNQLAKCYAYMSNGIFLRKRQNIDSVGSPPPQKGGRQKGIGKKVTKNVKKKWQKGYQKGDRSRKKWPIPLCVPPLRHGDRISTEKTFKFNMKKTAVYKLPRGAINQPPCVQIMNNPFLLYIKFCTVNDSCRFYGSYAVV